MKKEYEVPAVKVKTVDSDELLQMAFTSEMGNGDQLGKEEDLFFEEDELIHAPQLKSVWDE